MSPHHRHPDKYPSQNRSTNIATGKKVCEDRFRRTSELFYCVNDHMTIEQISQYANLAACGVVMLSWLLFAGTILPRRKPGSAPDSKREPGSWLGLALQLAGLAIAAI